MTMTFVNNLQITANNPNPPIVTDSGSYDVSSATFSIDVAEAGLERLDNHLFGHVVFNLPHPVAELWNGVAVIESQYR